MLIQSLVLIATMLILAGAIMTSTLVSAKAVLHQTILSKTQTAMSDATAAFVAYGQRFVKNHGTEQLTWIPNTPTTEPVCASSVTAATCPYIATMNWKVTGTSAAPVAKGATTGVANASYLADQIDEQRVSATISVVLSDATGKNVYGERSHEVTARIFNASPYLVVTGVRDVGSAVGDERSAEGDTGGTAQLGRDVFLYSEPNPADPANFNDTRIRTSIDCENSGSSRAYFARKFRPYGNLAWANEATCSSNQVTQGIPSGYTLPSGPLFVAEPANPQDLWRKNDEDTASFPR